MKEIIENGVAYTVSDNYPEPPYTKAAKTASVKNMILSRYEFRSLFTFPEMVAITTAAKTDVAIEVFMESMRVAEEINLDYPDVTNGLDYLISLDLISAEKKQQILEGVY